MISVAADPRNHTAQDKAIEAQRMASPSGRSRREAAALAAESQVQPAADAEGAINPPANTSQRVGASKIDKSD